jgi:hypothetical protein
MKVICRFLGRDKLLEYVLRGAQSVLGGARGPGLSDLEYKQVVQMKIARTYRE